MLASSCCALLFLLGVVVAPSRSDDSDFLDSGSGAEYSPDFATRLARMKTYTLALVINRFGHSLYRELARQTEDNVIFSPFSVVSVLAMLYRGATGDTATELRRLLCCETMKDSDFFSTYSFYLSDVMDKMDPKLYTAYSVSAMVVDKSFPVHEQYKEDVRDIFQAYVQEADVAGEGAAVVDRLNTWAKIKTKGAISELADHLEPDASLFLASAAYFKGAWKHKFDPEETKSHPFYNGGLKANAIEVQMMHSFATYSYYEEEEDYGFTAVELLYEGRNMSMVIYLPVEKDGLRELEANLTSLDLNRIRMLMWATKVHLTMPRFNLSYERSLSGAIQELGAARVFHAAKAQLSGITDRPASLALNEIKHKASLEVNEEGSTASAVTRAVMTKSLFWHQKDAVFNVNHPFLFAIFDFHTGLMLFMGRVTNL